MSTAAVHLSGDTSAAPGRGLSDPRLLAWRTVLAGRAVEVLRAYQVAWSDPSLDEAGRAAAAVGVVDPHPRAALLPLPGRGPFAELVEATGLAPGDEATLAASWWAAVDPQVAVLCGCVHDDAGRRHATLGLLAQLLAPLGVDVPLTVGEEHELVRSGLLDPVPDPATALRLPPTSVALLAGSRSDPPGPGSVAPRLAPLAAQVAALVAAGARVLVRCQVGDDRGTLRDAVATQLNVAVAPTPRSPALANLLLRLGHELPAVLLDDSAAPPPGAALALGGPSSWAPAGWRTLDAPPPSLDAAERAWRSALRLSGLRPRGSELAALVGRLPLAERSIASVVGSATTAARALGREPRMSDVSAALREHPRHDPAGLARRVPAEVGLDALVLPEATRSGLAELVAHARWSAAASAQLALGSGRGRAVIALLHGPSGTGKTAAAEAVAAELDRDLWVVDLARVVSKWLGETQRNLDQVLAGAASAGAVLLFDEADGLFGKRGEVTDARDRYANLEIDHLLQRVELHTGVVILTSNRPAALDEAFARRIRLSVRFELPDHGAREQIWRGYLPARLLADDVSLPAMAREELSGAAIRAAALAATVRALDDGTPVRAEHVHAAVRRELEKTRRLPTARNPR